MFLNKRIVKLMALGMAVSMTMPVLAQDQQTGDSASQQGRDQLFSRLDTNGDGVVNFAEFAAMPAPSLNRQDGNGDGNLSRDEMLEQRFMRMDRDGNGLLSADEMRGQQREGRRDGSMRAEGQRGQGQRADGERRQGEMRERMQNMTPEQRAQMRERMQNMTPEQREAMRAQMGQNAQSNGSAQSESANAAAHDH
jgi:Ca2+-binding EF-hand superfamily protein